MQRKEGHGRKSSRTRIYVRCLFPLSDRRKSVLELRVTRATVATRSRRATHADHSIRGSGKSKKPDRRCAERELNEVGDPRRPLGDEPSGPLERRPAAWSALRGSDIADSRAALSFSSSSFESFERSPAASCANSERANSEWAKSDSAASPAFDGAGDSEPASAYASRDGSSCC